jgi:hypothetical protein
MAIQKQGPTKREERCQKHYPVLPSENDLNACNVSRSLPSENDLNAWNVSGSLPSEKDLNVWNVSGKEPTFLSPPSMENNFVLLPFNTIIKNVPLKRHDNYLNSCVSL